MTWISESEIHMHISQDLFSALQSNTEGLDTEFKSARVGVPDSFWASYAAKAEILCWAWLKSPLDLR